MSLVTRLAMLSLAAAWSLPIVAQTNDGDLVPVTDQMLRDPPPADWLMWRRTYDSWGYSPLDDIDRRNVGELQLVWTRPLAPGIQEGTPLVHDGIMYFPNPNDITDAFDAATGDRLWEYRRPAPDDAGDYFPAPSINRNLAIYGGLLFDNATDNYAYALDARTGEVVWETKILDYTAGAQHSSGPIVANGKVISGRGCEPEGGPQACVVTAFDAETGKEIWRRHTIPAPGEPGDETWGDVPYEQRRHVGTWMVPSFDPDLNRIYIGTSVTSPAPKFMLAGNDKQYLYHNSTLALDADTGEIVWYFQHVACWSTPRSLRIPTQSSGSIRVCGPAKNARWSPASRGKPVWSTRSTASRGSSCGRGRRSTRTSSRASTSNPARRPSIRTRCSRAPASSA
jgi:glucose dehydrogenase